MNLCAHSQSTARPRRPLATSILSLLALGALGGGAARAAVVSWTGATDSFSAAGNWIGINTPPISGDSLVFGTAGVGGLLLNNNLTSGSFDLAGITFDSGAGAFVIGDGTATANAGNAFSLTGNVTNNSTSLQTINNPFSMTAVRTFTTTAGGGNLSLGGNLSGAGGGVLATGGGTLTLSGNNSFTGGTTVSQGTLVLDSNTAAGGFSAGAIALGNGSTGNGNVALNFAAGISGTDLTVRGGIPVRRLNPITVANTGSTGTATLGFTGSTAVIYSDLTLNRSVVLASNSATAGQRSFMGQITGPGAGAGNDSVIIDSGAGNWLSIFPKDTGTVSVANTFAGNLRVKSGNLELGGLTYISDIAANENLTIPATASVTVDSGATLQLVWGGQTFDALNGGGTIQRNTGDAQGTRILTIGASGGSGSFSGAITSLFNLTKTGAGTQILSGANTYTGATTISGGTLQIGNGGTTGSLAPASAITNNATVAFNRSNTVTQGTDFANVIGGSGSVIQQGSGTLILNGANTYSGGTTIASGAIQIGNGGSTASITGNVTNNGTFIFKRDDDYTFGGVISGSGAVVQDGYIVRLSAAQTYTGPTQINFGSYLILPATVNQGLASSSLVTIATGGFLDLSGRAQTFAGLAGGGTLYSSVANTGSLTLGVASGQTYNFSGTMGGGSPNFAFAKSGPGTQILSGANTYTGATTINGGTLQLGNNGVSGSLAPASAITNNATLAFNRTNSVIQGTDFGVIGGSGSVIQQGSGTLILTGANTYAGGTTISAGMLQLGNGGTTGSLSPSSAFTNNSTLVFNRTNTVTQGADFGSMITGNGSVIQQGSGTLVLTGANT